MMTDETHDKATREFRRMVGWIILFGVVLAIAAILYLALTGELFLHMVVATLGGVFLTVLLGCGLMAATFFSDKSGHDRTVTDATVRRDDS